MITHNGKTYKLVESSSEEDVLCSNCQLVDLCDKTADEMDMIEYILCATDEDYENFESPIYKEI